MACGGGTQQPYRAAPPALGEREQKGRQAREKGEKEEEEEDRQAKQAERQGAGRTQGGQTPTDRRQTTPQQPARSTPPPEPRETNKSKRHENKHNRRPPKNQRSPGQTSKGKRHENEHNPRTPRRGKPQKRNGGRGREKAHRPAALSKSSAFPSWSRVLSSCHRRLVGERAGSPSSVL